MVQKAMKTGTKAPEKKGSAFPGTGAKGTKGGSGGYPLHIYSFILAGGSTPGLTA